MGGVLPCVHRVSAYWTVRLRALVYNDLVRRAGQPPVLRPSGHSGLLSGAADGGVLHRGRGAGRRWLRGQDDMDSGESEQSPCKTQRETDGPGGGTGQRREPLRVAETSSLPLSLRSSL